MICPETERPCQNECPETDRCAHWLDQGLTEPTGGWPEGMPSTVQEISIEPTPKPSIQVGDQVRLTGVATVPTQKRDGAIGVQIDGAAGPADTMFVFPTSLEIIRQPFKRGEVVYLATEPTKDLPCVVISDESKSGYILLAAADENATVQKVEADLYERRP